MNDRERIAGKSERKPEGKGGEEKVKRKMKNCIRRPLHGRIALKSI